MTPEQQELVERLRAILPRPARNSWGEGTQPSQDIVCIDCEWDTNYPFALQMIGVGNESWVSQFAWQELDPARQQQLRDELMALCASTSVVMWNAVADIKKLREALFPFLGPQVFARLEDGMLLHHLLESEESHTLEDVGAEYGSLPAYKHLRTVAGAEAEYNGADLVQTCLVWRRLRALLDKDPRAEFIYRAQSLPMIWLIIEGEEAGIRVDPATPLPLYRAYDLKRAQATLLAHAYSGWPLNLNSPDQIKHALYNLEGLPEQRDTKGVKWGKPTTGKEAIAALRRRQGTEWDADVPPTLAQAWANIDEGGHPLLEARYLFMGAQQAISHYIMPCLDVADRDFEGGYKGDLLGPVDRIWPECRQHVQASGRHSYVGPALSQMKDDMLGLIAPDPGTVWFSWDWKQIEVRLLAYLANDAAYIDAFARGEDIHEVNTRTVFGPPGTPELEALRRRFIKAFVFRLHYRGKPENAGNIPGTKSLGLDSNRLVEASHRYLDVHPALPAYWASLEAEANQTGGVRTFMGRFRKLTGQYLAQRNREACNHPMQGGVSDIYATTALLVKAAAPWARLVYGSFDSQTWQLPEARRLEFAMLCQPIVERTFTINGRDVSFPADYKLREAAEC